MMRFILSKLGLGALRHDPAVRAISWQTLISRIGNGLFMTIEVIYITQVVGLSAFEVSIALGAGGLVSLLFAVPSGMIADRFGAKRVLFAAHIIEAFALLPLMFVRDFWSLFAVNVVVFMASTMGHTATSTVISKMGAGEDRVTIRAAQRAMANLGIALGTVLAGVALWIDTPIAYQSAIFLDFLMFLLAATFIFRLPRIAPTTKRGEKLNLIAFKDWRFLAATILNGVVSFHFIIQGVALPLWILHYTDVPKWWVSVLFVINTVLVTVLQIRLSRGTGDLMVSVKKFRLGTAYLLASCLVYSSAANLDIWLSATILGVGMVIHTLGELYAAAGSWSIGFELAVEKHMGQYQGVYSLGWGLGGTFGPLYITAMVVGLGVIGWVIMGLVFLAAGIVMHALVKRHPILSA
jgi:predicted MFS family arabinose efflux permease